MVKKLVEVTEVDGEGLMALMGQRITIFALNYIYTGKLSGINATCVLLSDASIVYETGVLNDNEWKDAQSLPGDWYVQLNCIESFGVLK